MSTDLPFAELPTAQLTPDQLAAQLRYHSHRYYELAQPVISDAEFDALVEQLRRLAPSHPALTEVGAQASADDKVRHARPMLSLEKCNTPGEFDAWLKGAAVTLTGRSHQSLTGAELDAWAMGAQARLVATPKVDGLACSLHYGADGRLTLAATRGDGTIGENVTHNARQMTAIPQQVLHGPLEVRGEIYLPLSTFRTVADQYANPRNLAAGTLKSKERPALPPDQLRFFAYDLLGPDVASESEKLRQAAELGFAPAPWRACQPAEAAAIVRQFADEREALDYEADGVVLKFDDVAVQERLGLTAHHPRGAVAWKFAVEAGQSTLEDIEWSVSRTGTITPVAIVAPVVLSGASVTRATLHNVSNLRRLGLQIGDRVELVRRGGVIPHLERTLGGGGALVEPPGKCPSCGAPAVEQLSVRKVGGDEVRTIVLCCSQPQQCSVARHRQILHYASTLEIEGLGEKVLDLLLEQGLVRDAADLYTLQAGDLLALPSFAELKAANLLKQIDKARSVPLPMLLVALGIDHLGKHAAQMLAARWSLAELRERRVEEIGALHSLGEVTARRIHDGLREAAPLLDRLLAHVAVVQPSAQAAGSGPLAGQVVVFTGKLERMGRRDAQQRVQKLGGLAGDSVTTETTLLVVGADELDAATPSSKLKKARKLQEAGGAIEILPEADFWQRVAP
jgi:DNA ligase (NAD+)